MTRSTAWAVCEKARLPEVAAAEPTTRPLPTVLALAKYPNVVVKMSERSSYSSQLHPYKNIHGGEPTTTCQMSFAVSPFESSGS
jgi:hypothetical protein